MRKIFLTLALCATPLLVQAQGINVKDLPAATTPLGSSDLFAVTQGGTFHKLPGTSLGLAAGLGTIATQNANAVAITGGAITGSTTFSLTNTISGAITQDTAVDRVHVTSDQVTASTSSLNLFGLAADYECCGSGATNATRFALAGRMNITGQPSSSSTDNNYVGILGFAVTNVTAPAAGGFIAGINSNVLVQNTGWSEAVGLEIDMTTQQQVAKKEAIKVVQAASDAFTGSGTDTVLEIANQPGAVGWVNIIHIDLTNAPLHAGANILNIDGGTATITNGINFSALTFGGCEYQSSNFNICGSAKSFSTNIWSPITGHAAKINDGGNGTMLDVVGAGGVSAANLAISSATTGNPVIIGTEGSDTDIDLEFRPKGAGHLTLNGNSVYAVSGATTNGNCVEFGTGNILTDTGAPCSSGGGGGSVTSVGLTVPATSILGISGSPITTAGTMGLTTTGTSGGIPYFSSTSQLTSSTLLTNNAILTGGGVGASPKSVAITGLVLGNGASAPGAYGGASACSSGNFVTAFSSSGATTCANASTGIVPSTTIASTIACNGSTDVTSSMQSALNAFSSAGGGQYLIPVGKGCVIGTSADLTLPYNVEIVCSQNGGGAWTSGDYAAVADFLINPAHRIDATSGTSPPQGGRSGVFGCTIVRQGFTPVVTLRDSINSVAAYAGTALVCDNQFSVTFQDNLIIGFNTAIFSNCQQFNARRNRIDSLNGVFGSSCFDTCYIDQNEVWPFGMYTLTQAGSSAYQDTAISAITNNGGAFEITFASPPAVALVNGDRIVVHDAGGSPAADGRWTIGLIDSTHFTLTGSTFAGSYTSGGSAFLSSASRAGIAFNFANGQFFGSQNLSFGWDQGVAFDNGNEGSICANCWIDGYQNSKDPVPIGVWSKGTSGNSQYSGYLGQPASQVVVSGSSGAQFLRVTDSFLVGIGAGSGGVAVIQVDTGTLSITGGTIIGTPSNANFIGIEDTAGIIRMSNVVIPSGNISFQTATTDCPKLQIDGVTGPCGFTPTIKGDSTAGAFTYTTQNGLYTASRDGVNVSIDLSWSTIGTPASGTNTLIAGIPVAAGTNSGSCTLGYFAGMPLPAGNSLQAGIPASGSNVTLFAHAAVTGVTTAYSPSTLVANSTIQTQCHFFQ